MEPRDGPIPSHPPRSSSPLKADEEAMNRTTMGSVEHHHAWSHTPLALTPTELLIVPSFLPVDVCSVQCSFSERGSSKLRHQPSACFYMLLLMISADHFVLYSK